MYLIQPTGISIKKLQARGIEGYLINMIMSYFQNRNKQIDRENSFEVAAGVPQGSVLGPTLWNIMYDDVMSLPRSRDVELICYADDLAVLIRTKTVQRTIELGNKTLTDLNRWMTKNNLAIAPEKNAAVVFSWSYVHRRDIRFSIENHEIIPEKTIKYLGVTLDYCLRFTTHIERVIEKAGKTIRALNALLPNIGGPSAGKRKVMASAVQSIILYAAPVWKNAVNTARNEKRLLSCQRSFALRCISAYHTVSTEAALVISGQIPITQLAKERARIYERNTTTELEKKRVGMEERQKRRKSGRSAGKMHKRVNGLDN